ncbi:MAG: hypothetical protein ACLQVI_26155 [Polyangiaceae bacterium]
MADPKPSKLIEESEAARKRGEEQRTVPGGRDFVIPPRGTPGPDHDVDADRRALERGIRNEPAKPYPNTTKEG